MKRMKWVLLTVVVLAGVFAAFVLRGVDMPGTSYVGELDPLTLEEFEAARLMEKHVRVLAEKIGPRNHVKYKALQAAQKYIRLELEQQGYEVQAHTYTTRNKLFTNLFVEINGAGKPEQIVIVGAHYDTAMNCPGADGNASGVAMLLELTRLFKGKSPDLTLRFVFFTNEEPPFFQTPFMGSLQYAQECHYQDEDVKAMISLDMVGYYSDKPGSQHVPWPLESVYPNTGDFIAFMGDSSSGKIVRSVLQNFRNTTKFPSQGAVIPALVPGISWSDHWSFWQQGYDALLVTDTFRYRNPNYHTSTDTPDTLDYERMAHVKTGMVHVICDLAKIQVF